jgi:outer membrane protein TolC
MVRTLPAAAAALLPLLASGCVVYEPAPVELAQVLAQTVAPPPGPLRFDDAVAFALAHNPELARLAALARAEGADVPPFDAQLQWDGHDERVAAMIDPLALLGLGARGAAIDAAAARADEALAELAVARWQLTADIASAYVVLAALATVAPPPFDVDPEPFVQAGLASPTTAALARAAAAVAGAEREMLAGERAAVLADLCRSLGLRADAPVEPVLPDADFPALPPATDAQLLRRADLALALARYHAADAAFRSAVAAQYPSLMIGPDLAVGPGTVEAMAVLRLPLGAAGPARAAEQRRDAARHRLATDVLAASAQAHALWREHEAAEQRARATAASAAASRAALDAATAALAVEVDAFEPLVERAQMALRDAMEHRQAAVAAARHRVAKARAWGWPWLADAVPAAGPGVAP